MDAHPCARQRRVCRSWARIGVWERPVVVGSVRVVKFALHISVQCSTWLQRCTAGSGSSCCDKGDCVGCVHSCVLFFALHRRPTRELVSFCKCSLYPRLESAEASPSGVVKPLTGHGPVFIFRLFRKLPIQDTTTDKCTAKTSVGDLDSMVQTAPSHGSHLLLLASGLGRSDSLCSGSSSSLAGRLHRLSGRWGHRCSGSLLSRLLPRLGFLLRC